MLQIINDDKNIKICPYSNRGDFMISTQPKTQKRIIAIFSFIYILNCTDLLFTYTYLKTGMFIEYNPIMRTLLHYSSLTILFKLMLPAVLVIYFFFRLDDHTPFSLLLCKWGGALLSLIYILLNLMHLYYLFQFFYFSS